MAALAYFMCMLFACTSMHHEHAWYLQETRYQVQGQELDFLVQTVKSCHGDAGNQI